jgi:hypothetical protein
MDFEPTDEQRMLRESLSRLLEDRYTSRSATRIAHRAGYDPAIWNGLCRHGADGAQRT